MAPTVHAPRICCSVLMPLHNLCLPAAVFIVITPAANKGQDCEVPDKTAQNYSCNPQLCPVSVVLPGNVSSTVPPTSLFGSPSPTVNTTAGPATSLMKVDCVGNWTDWGQCSEPCAGGQQSSIFVVTLPAANGGHECDVTNGTVQRQPCNNQPCAAPPSTADAGTANPSQAGVVPAAMAQNSPVPTGSLGLSGAAPVGPSNSSAAPVDCIGIWGLVGQCSKPCGGGSQTAGE